MTTKVTPEMIAVGAGDLDAALNGKQPLDATLTALAGLITSADKLPYFTGVDALALTTLSVFIRTVLDDADAATARATLGAADAATVAGLVIDSIADADTTHAPSRNSVFDALAGKQPLDATLTALAGANWAANTMPIGSGTDTMSQVSFNLNTFPARSSSGTLTSKPITDFGLSLVDDADAATARATLSLADGSVVPTTTAVANVNTHSGTILHYTRVGNRVSFSGRVDIQPTAAAGTLTQLGVSLPIASNFAATSDAFGTVTNGENPYTSGMVTADTTNDRLLVSIYATTTATRSVAISGHYQIL